MHAFVSRDAHNLYVSPDNAQGFGEDFLAATCRGHPEEEVGEGGSREKVAKEPPSVGSGGIHRASSAGEFCRIAIDAEM